MNEENSYAIVATGGKQYRVKTGQEILVERLKGTPGDSVDLDRVLFIKAGSESKLGTPLVEGATIQARIVAEEKGDKQIIFKKKRRKGHTKKQGHRQKYTRLLIESINA